MADYVAHENECSFMLRHKRGKKHQISCKDFLLTSAIAVARDFAISKFHQNKLYGSGW